VPSPTPLLWGVHRRARVGWRRARGHALPGGPFHLAGYALPTSFGIDYIWFCLVVASAAKLLVLEHGGIKAHRRAVPFFLGLILGEFAVGSFWSALSVIIQQGAYTFWIF
jgi:hypothetical protein